MSAFFFFGNWLARAEEQQLRLIGGALEVAGLEVVLHRLNDFFEEVLPPAVRSRRSPNRQVVHIEWHRVYASSGESVPVEEAACTSPGNKVGDRTEPCRLPLLGIGMVLVRMDSIPMVAIQLLRKSRT
ncbi:hypothetical protein ISCGN_032081 [Ixodes scapularis]